MPASVHATCSVCGALLVASDPCGVCAFCARADDERAERHYREAISGLNPRNAAKLCRGLRGSN